MHSLFLRIKIKGKFQREFALFKINKAEMGNPYRRKCRVNFRMKKRINIFRASLQPVYEFTEHIQRCI